MINTKKLINELNNIKIDLKILELIEEQYKYQQMQLQKKTIIKKLQRLQQSLVQ
ncbi:hypothetical protein [Megamonas funiformis]|uniref:hypothetical protein n=1 Tax=Megamonas funiformis TaxID=437897 RepID=UPI0022E484F6|nr:hypothetical protein [Megamonas funiformis]